MSLSRRFIGPGLAPTAGAAGAGAGAGTGEWTGRTGPFAVTGAKIDPFTALSSEALAGGLGDGVRLGFRIADRRGIFGLGLFGSGFDDPAFA